MCKRKQFAIVSVTIGLCQRKKMLVRTRPKTCLHNESSRSTVLTCKRNYTDVVSETRILLKGSIEATIIFFRMAGKLEVL